MITRDRAMSEMTFIITREADGDFVARGKWPDGDRELITRGRTRDDVLSNIREAVELSFRGDRRRPGKLTMRFDPPELAREES